MADPVREMAAKCRNWGKWGPDDELGTLNYITPETVVKATRAVKRGVTFSLAIPSSRAPAPSGTGSRRWRASSSRAACCWMSRA